MSSKKYISCANTLKLCSRESIEDIDPDKLYNAFKYFRDLCKKEESLQNGLCNELLSVTVSIINEIVSNYKENLLAPLKQGLQFVSNLTVASDNNKLNIWEECRSQFALWMTVNDNNVRNYICAILYNVTLAYEDLLLDIVNNVSLLKHVVHSALNESDFALLLLEHMWKLLKKEDADMLMKNLFKCDPFAYVHILNILFDFVLNDSEMGFNFVVWSKDKYKDVLKAVNPKFKLDDEDRQEIVTLLKILVSVSSRDRYISFLQQDIGLFRATKLLLEKVHYDTKYGNDSYCPGLNMISERTAFENLKANLIRFIGNLCWRNKLLQDTARESHGILLILDCCIRDGCNPFITESVIFAVRNICEGNVENQKFVKELNEKTHEDKCITARNWPSVIVPS